MVFLHRYVFAVMWLGFFIYWQTKSANLKAAQRRESAQSGLVRLALILCAVALLTLPRVPFAFLNTRFLPRTDSCFWAGAALTGAGLLFAIWARRHLGANWSRAVTVKENHELITSGPYMLVRHPIYSGLLLAMAGSAVARGEWRGLLAVVLIFVALWRKLKLEEQWMRSQFGEAYVDYSRRVSALVPHIL